MPLSDDQKAMLRLLAQREEGYEDIAALMGIGVDEVRARVKEALAALDRDRVAPAAGRVVAGDPPAPAVAKAPSEAGPPAASPAEGRPAPAATRQPRSAPRLSVPKSRRRLYELAGGGLVVLLIVLFATGVLDIGGGGSSGEGSKGTGESTTATKGNAQLTQAVLQPVGESDASGRAVFGRLGKEVVLQVTAKGLEPASNGNSYAVWLYRSPKLALRIGSARASKSGELAARFAIPAELLAYVASGAFNQVYLARGSDATYEAEVAKAKKQSTLPRYSGETVLRGKITGPVVKAGRKSGR